MAVPVVAVHVSPGFSAFHFSVPCIVFSDIVPGAHLFSVEFFSESPRLVKSNAGISVDVKHGLKLLESADIVVIPFWSISGPPPNKPLINALRGAWERGATIVGLCLGSYALAYAGLLDGRRAATHWEFEKDFAKRFPFVRLDHDALYTEDERLVTSAGSSAGIDCCLYLIRQYYGSVTANRVARRMVTVPYRDGGQAQFIEPTERAAVRDTKLNLLFEYLHQNLDKVLQLDSLAHYSGMSRRTLTRRFHKETGMTVNEWLCAERLKKSQELLEVTCHPIEQVAELAGFQSTAAFRQNFKARFGVSPSEWRKSFQIS